jgi:hypothetical protein
MPVLRGLSGLLALGHHRLTGVRLVAPMGQPRPTDTRQPRPHLEERSLRRRLLFERALGAVALARD